MSKIIITDDVAEEMMLGIVDPSDEELARVQTPSLKMWNYVRCSKCKKAFDIVVAKWDEGNVCCTHCGHRN